MRARGFAEDLTLSIVLRTFGRMEEAYVYHDRLKQRLEPGWFGMLFLVYGEMVMRNYDEALAAAHRLKALYPDGFAAPYALGRACLAAEHYQEAIKCFLEASGLGPGTELRGLLGRAYALAGDRTNALEQVAQLEPRVLNGDADPYPLAWIYAGLGQKDEALDNLERAVEYNSAYVTHADWGGLRTDQAWEDLRDEPRFEAICRSVGLGKDQWPR